MQQPPLSAMFERITDPENIRKAYLDLVRKFDLDSKSHRYRGVDGLKLSGLDFISEKTIPALRAEMLAFAKISPAYMTTIPKKNGKKRKIYVYPVKERIKAEAIYRVLLPFFDAYFSPFLFSYRSSHPSYYAARSAIRRYKRHYGENHVLVTDISDYADTIDHGILMGKLVSLGIDPKTLALLELFVKTDTLEEGTLVKRPRGVLTGTPLYALLSNFYMDDFDKWAGKRVAFYRRVGDDIIAMDRDGAKIAEVAARLAKTADELKLKLNKDKARLIRDTEAFNFLGYSFKDAKIGFDENSRGKALSAWKKKVFSTKARSDSGKMRHLRSIATSGSDNLVNQFAQLIDQKILIDDTEQVREFSEAFFRMVTSFFRGKYSDKKRRTIGSLLRRSRAPSLFRHYLDARYPKNHASHQ